MRRPFMAMCIAGVAGIMGGLLLPVWAGGLLLLLSVCICIMMNRTANQTSYGVWIAVFLIVGFCRVWTGDFLEGGKTWIEGVEDGTYVSFEGRVKKAEKKNNSTWLTMSCGQDEVLVILLKTKFSEDLVFYKGQIYAVDGEIRLCSAASNPGQFDEAAYYRSLGIGAKVMAERVSLRSEGDLLHRGLRGMEDLRMRMAAFYLKTMSVKGAGVIMAAVIGDRSEFGEDVRRIWQQNGWMHLVTVSGLHLSFIAMGLYRRMRKMTVSLAAASAAAMAAMLAYGYMTDFGESMIRACIMMTLCIFSVIAGRRYDRPTALAFAAFVMMMMRPERIFNIGFILSFTAIMGTLRTAEFMIGTTDDKALSAPEKLKVRLRESLYLQRDIFLTTLPVIAGAMYEIPVFGFFYNLLMIPLIAVVVPVAFAAGIAGASGISIIKMTAARGMWIIDKILKIVVTLPGKTYVCGCPKRWQTAVYLILMILWILPWVSDIEKRARLHVNGGVGKRSIYAACCRLRWFRRLLPLLAVVLLIGVRDRRDRILFLDVGQGDGICFMGSNGETVLLDGGSSDVKSLWRYRIAPAMKYYGRDRVDVWFLTHGDKDHISGIQEALTDKSVKIGSVITPKVKDSEALLMIQEKADAAGCITAEIYPAETLSFGGFCLTCLYPGQETICQDENDRSLVLSMTHTGSKEIYRALFMGDLSELGEAKLLKRLPEKVAYDLLKARHHGSKSSTSESLLKEISPAAAVISCGAHNRYGHPHKETLDRLCRAQVTVLRTDQIGAVEIIFNREGEARAYAFKDLTYLEKDSP